MTAVNVAPSAPQRRVLVALKRRGEATADQLAVALDVSPSAIRQHLNALQSSGFVEVRKNRGHRGRPASRYHATDLTETLFAPTDDRLSIELLEHVEQEDPELVKRVFDRRRRRLVQDARDHLAGKPASEQITALTELLDQQGYLADSQALDPRHYRINLHSCPIWTVANHYQQACNAELDFIRDLIPNATITRITHKTAGAHTCAYDITLSR